MIERYSLPEMAAIWSPAHKTDKWLQVELLACEGWAREGVIPAEAMCPAAGQGALAMEIRTGDAAIAQHVRFLDSASARASTTCERALLKKLGGGCQVPIGAFAEIRDGRLHLQAVVAAPDGTKVLRESRHGSDPIQLGEIVGEALLQQGGQAILDEVYGRGVAVPQQP